MDIDEEVVYEMMASMTLDDILRSVEARRMMIDDALLQLDSGAIDQDQFVAIVREALHGA